MGIFEEKVTLVRRRKADLSTLIETSLSHPVAPLVAPFLDAGRPATGDYTCADCGYGVAVRSMLPVCPMCQGLTWEPTASSQYGLLPF